MSNRMAESPSDESLNDYYSNLLQLSLPDNEQTWLYCLPGSDPNAILDISHNVFLSLDSLVIDKSSHIPSEGKCTSGHVQTLLPQRRSHNIKEKRIAKLSCPKNKSINNLDDSTSNEENSTLLVNLPIQSKQLKSKPKLKDRDIAKRDLDNTNFVVRPAIDEYQMKVINSSTNLNYYSWNTSERTLLVNVSAPIDFMDTTSVTASSTPVTASSDFSNFPKFSFNPNSVSTPTKNFFCDNKSKISINPESPVNTNTIEDEANNTYNLSSNDGNDEQSKNACFNITTVISTTNNEIEHCADVIEDFNQSGVLQSTYIFEDPVPKILNEEGDLNSTITIKSKDSDDSEQDSCYSSSSNIRSLGDVCYMSQLKPQKITGSIKSVLKKNKSEDSLCLPEHASNIEKPKKHYGSALNLGPRNNNQVTSGSIDSGFKKNKSEDFLCLSEQPKNTQKPMLSASVLHLGPQSSQMSLDSRYQNPNYFSRRSGNQIVPNVNSQNNSDKSVSVEKPIPTRQLSKIPRLQSRIPKLISKK